MLIDILAPEVGEGVTQVTVTEWLIKVGDKVEADEVIVELMTDKAAFDLPSPATGILIEILVEDDTEVKVGEVIGKMETDSQQSGATHE